MTPGGISIDLGYPNKDLSPNARVHHMALYRLKKSAKDEAYWATKYMLPRPWSPPVGRIPVKIIAYPPDRRDRDADNAIASMKASLDGISSALGVNDSLFDLSFQWGEPAKGGKVIIEVGP